MNTTVISKLIHLIHLTVGSRKRCIEAQVDVKSNILRLMCWVGCAVLGTTWRRDLTFAAFSSNSLSINELMLFPTLSNGTYSGRRLRRSAVRIIAAVNLRDEMIN